MRKFRSVEETRNINLVFPKFRFVPSILHKVYFFLITLLANVEFVGLENLPLERNVCLFPNHISNADNIVLWEAWRRSGRRIKDLWAVAGIVASTLKERIAYRTSYSFVYVERRRDVDKEIQTAINKKSLRIIGRMMKEGESFFFYLEGSRSRTGALRLPPDEKDKKSIGPALITGTDIIPVAIQGTDKILKPEYNDQVIYVIKNAVIAGIRNLFSWLPFVKPFERIKVRVEFKKPIKGFEKQRGEFSDSYIDRVYNIIVCEIALILPEELWGYYKKMAGKYRRQTQEQRSASYV